MLHASSGKVSVLPSRVLPSFTTEMSWPVLRAVHTEDSQGPHLGTNRTAGVVRRNYSLNKLRI